MKIANMEAEITSGADGIIISFKVPPNGFIKLLEQLKKESKANVKVLTKKEAPALEAKLDDLFKKVKQYQDLNPSKYPKRLYVEFMKYWGEASKDGKGIRYEKEKYFDMGKRLATFKSFVKTEELSAWWEEHNKTSVHHNNKLF